MGMEEDEAAAKVAGIFRMWHARKRVRWMLKQVVTRHWDEGAGAEYYFNAKTGLSSWTKSRLFGEEELPWEGYDDADATEAVEDAVGDGGGGAGGTAAVSTNDDYWKDDDDDGDDSKGSEMKAEELSGHKSLAVLERTLEERKKYNPKAGHILCIPATSKEQYQASIALFAKAARLVPICVRYASGPYRAIVSLDRATEHDQSIRLFAFDRSILSETELTFFTEEEPERYGLLTDYARVEPVLEFTEYKVLGSAWISYTPRAHMTPYYVYYTHSPYRSLISKDITAGAIWKSHFTFYAYNAALLHVKVSPDREQYAVALEGTMEDWDTDFSFTVFTEPIPGTTRCNVLERHDPVRRFKISLGNIAARSGWTLVFSFYVLEVPLPGVMKLAIHSTNIPEGCEQSRISRYMALPPWRHSAYIYVYEP